MSLVLRVCSQDTGLYLFRSLGSLYTRKASTPHLCYSAITTLRPASPEAPLQRIQGIQRPNYRQHQSPGPAGIRLGESPKKPLCGVTWIHPELLSTGLRVVSKDPLWWKPQWHQLSHPVASRDL